MKKAAAILIFSIGLALYGCGSTAGSEMEDMGISGTELPKVENGNTSEPELSGAENGNASEPAAELQDENVTGTEAAQGGPYGRISVSLPAGWSYETCPIDSDDLVFGMYGMHFYPDGVTDGYIALVYIDTFGVCGTGLEEKTVSIAGEAASMGTYDGHEYWDFISFQGENEGIVALTYSVDDWWSEYSDQVLEILDTLSFE